VYTAGHDKLQLIGFAQVLHHIKNLRKKAGKKAILLTDTEILMLREEKNEQFSVPRGHGRLKTIMIIIQFA